MSETSPIPNEQPAPSSFACAAAASSHSDKIINDDANDKTWFGHHMAFEGSYQNLPIVTCASFTAIGLMSVVTSLSTGCHLLTIPIYYVVGLVIFYGWHVAAHYWTGSDLQKVHMQHHQDYYPPHDFYGDLHPAVQASRRRRGYRAATLLELTIPRATAVGAVGTTSDASGSTDARPAPVEKGPVRLAHEGPLIVVLAVLILLSYFVLDMSIGVCLWVLAIYIVMGLIGSAIHMSFHERGFWLEPYAWYRELRALHMIHHVRRRNFAMVNIWLDLVFCSLMVRDS
jgi:hypothetical protein